MKYDPKIRIIAIGVSCVLLIGMLAVSVVFGLNSVIWAIAAIGFMFFVKEAS